MSTFTCVSAAECAFCPTAIHLQALRRKKWQIAVTMSETVILASSGDVIATTTMPSTSDSADGDSKSISVGTNSGYTATVAVINSGVLPYGHLDPRVSGASPCGSPSQLIRTTREEGTESPIERWLTQVTPCPYCRMTERISASRLEPSWRTTNRLCFDHPGTR